MPQFAANLSLLYNRLPFVQRIAQAADDGFAAIECQFPYEGMAGISMEDLRAELTRVGLPLVLHNLPAGHWSNGDRGIACNPKRVKEFRDGIPLALEYAKALNVPRLNCLAGILPAEISQHEATQTFLDNLNYAAPLLANAGIKLLIEPINTYDIPGFFLSTSTQAIDILMSVQSNNVYLQYDAYHMHRMGEDILEIEDLMPFIDHIQIADHPGRHEPGTGEIPFVEFFELLDDLDYKGWVGCEYAELHQANFFK